jgi:alanine-synthesizing transaminase
MSETEQFYRIQKLPPYVFAVVNEMKAKLRAAGRMWSISAWETRTGKRPRAHRVENGRGRPQPEEPPLFDVARAFPKLRLEICKRYERNYGVQLDPETEAITTIGAKDALAHLLFAVIGPGDAVVSP